MDRVFDILECLGRNEDGMRLTDLSSELDLPVSTTHRLVKIMNQRGYLEKDSETKRYFIGLKILELRGQALRRRRLLDQAESMMEELKQQTEELVHLAVILEGEVVYIRSVEGPHTMGMYTPVGSRAPVHCTSLGKAMIAHLPNSEVEAIIKEKGLPRQTVHTITSWKELQADLEEVRARGYAVDSMENEVGVRCLGAPIFNYEDRVIASVSVSGPSARLSKEKDGVNGAYVLEAAQEISARMGAKVMDSEA